MNSIYPTIFNFLSALFASVIAELIPSHRKSISKHPLICHFSDRVMRTTVWNIFEKERHIALPFTNRNENDVKITSIYIALENNETYPLPYKNEPTIQGTYPFKVEANDSITFYYLYATFQSILRELVSSNQLDNKSKLELIAIDSVGIKHKIKTNSFIKDYLN